MTELTRILVNESYNTILSAVNRETHPDDLGSIKEELEGIIKLIEEREEEINEPEEKPDKYAIKLDNEVMKIWEY